MGHAVDILTFNVWGLPWPLARHRRRRFEGILGHLAAREDHVVGLQEVWGGSHRELPGLRRGRQERDAGLALGSALPVDGEPTVQHFTRAQGTCAFKAKGVMVAEIGVEEVGAVRILVTHLQAHARYASTRAHQVDEVLEFASASHLPTFLLGDFNFHDDEADDLHAHERLLAEGFIDAAEQADATHPTWTPENVYARAGHGPQRFDRIYVRPSTRVHVAVEEAAVLLPETPLSDHHPVHARVLLSRR